MRRRASYCVREANFSLILAKIRYYAGFCCIWWVQLWYNIDMLNQNNRLKKLRDFNLLLKYGQYVGGQFFTLKLLDLAKKQDYFPKKEDPGEFKKQLRLAFVVGLKVSKKAVERNRLKRQMREVVRLLIKDERVKSGYYVMVVAKNEALGKEYGEISKEIEGLLGKIGIVK